MLRMAIITVAALVVASANAWGKPPPPHLAAMAAALYRATAEDLEKASGDTGRAWSVARAKRALDRQGIAKWAAQPVRLKGAAPLAAALGLDPAKESDRALLAETLRRTAAGEGEAAVMAIAEARGFAGDVARVTAMRNAFDKALAEAVKDLETHYAFDLPEEGQSLAFDWKLQQGRFEIVYEEPGSERSEPLMAVIEGDVAASVAEDGNTLDFSVAPAEEPIRPFSSADFVSAAASIFGEWTSQGGDVWIIAPPDGAMPESDPAPAGQGPSLAEQIRQKKERIAEIRAAKVYVWNNPDTGAEERQDRFRRLDEPWIYVGEQFATPDGEAEIARLEQEIATLETGRSESTPPVLQHDPIGFRETGNAQSVVVTVRQKNGWTFTYDEARFDGRRILARRTLRDTRDIEDLPASVVSQLIAGWSPPEWIELEPSVDRGTGKPTLKGQWWRLHVTYESFFGSPGDVTSIHTPWNKRLELTKENRRGP